MFQKAHIKNVNADDLELGEKLAEIYPKKIILVKNTRIIDYVEEKQVAALFELKNYFANKNQTILVTLGGI